MCGNHSFIIDLLNSPSKWPLKTISMLNCIFSEAVCNKYMLLMLIAERSKIAHVLSNQYHTSFDLIRLSGDVPAMSVRTRIYWLYPLERGVLSITLNNIWWWGFNSGALGSVPLLPGPLWLWLVVPMKVLSYISIGLCAKKNPLKN